MTARATFSYVYTADGVVAEGKRRKPRRPRKRPSVRSDDAAILRHMSDGRGHYVDQLVKRFGPGTKAALLRLLERGLVVMFRSDDPWDRQRDGIHHKGDHLVRAYAR